MFDCSNLLHPFQNDPGVSQRQRIMDDLLSGNAKIDGRSMADLLDYFVQLSRHINYYDNNLNISDWQPFFQKSLPFSLAAMIKYNRDTITKKAEDYTLLFNKHPSPSGLQLLIHYIFYEVINRINTWHLQLKDSGLPAELILVKLIKDKLQAPVEQFICFHNVAVKEYCIKPVSFLLLSQNEVWNLDTNKLHANNCIPPEKTRRKRLIALYDQVNSLLPSFLDPIRIIADTAEQSMEQSFFPLKEELQERHTPHLALLFAFLKLFQHLQGDLNTFTKKHLDFFYKEVLKLKAKEAVPDKVHLVFEIQKQLDKYLLKKGLLAKDGKDNNKAEILFALDDEIVVNKAQVADKRTLFLNNKNIYEQSYLEGVYMAPDAGKADGVSKDFKDRDPKSFPTLGAKWSKYTDPEKNVVKPYPNARLGFILASPVLLLSEGERTVDITLACELKENYCSDLPEAEAPSSNNCCEERRPDPEVNLAETRKYQEFVNAINFYPEIKAALEETYYYISEELIVNAAKKGISKPLEKKLRDLLTEIKTKNNSNTICYCPVATEKYDTVLKKAEWNTFYNTVSNDEKKILDEFFKPLSPLKVSFSGEKEWIEPDSPLTISVSPSPLPNDHKFLLKVTAVLKADKPAVTFYDKDQLKEDFDTNLPLVKIELNDKIKLLFTKNRSEKEINRREEDCCLLKDVSEDELAVSLYHFFRNVVVRDEVNGDETKVGVRVCGLKNFVVQNEESVQDVNGPIYPFGTRPEVPDFNLVNPPDTPLTNPNLIGPDFYIGTKEIFCKKWEEVFININWKNKPSSFEEYYKGYWVNPTDSTDFGLKEDDFQVNIAVLDNGFWRKEKIHALKNPPPANTIHNPVTNDENRPLFKDDGESSFCSHNPPDDVNPIEQTIQVSNTYFTNYKQAFSLDQTPLTKYEADTKFGFLKLNLQNQDFLHKDYSFVLARQMMAFGRYPDLIDGAIYIEGGNPQVFDISVFFGNLGPKVIDLANEVVNGAITHILDDLIDVITTEIENTIPVGFLNDLIAQCKDLLNQVVAIAALPDIATLFAGPFDVTALTAAQINNINDQVKTFVNDLFDLVKTDLSNVEDNLKDKIKARFDDILDTIDTGGWFGGLFTDKEVPIPNEPWTPVIKNMSLDYRATAGITDIDLIHLYPYENTYKHEELSLQPALFPTFCDEGTLFLGLKDLVPGNNLNLLFQLAEATADSESEREDVSWHYLDNNQWKTLRKGFELLDDATDGLTTSGIIKFALPENMTKDNTILPKELHWIKASVPKNSRAVCETLGIHSQAIQATFTNEIQNDKLRLSQPLPAGAISKLYEADTSVKKLAQPYDTYGGRIPEAEGHFYVRVSELLRHKGRAIQKFDYERLVLEAFPKLYKVKCINHSFALNAYQYKNDFPMAPGYVILAVIPDLNQLKAVQSFEPRAPVSLLENIEDYIKRRTSPFVRFRAMNPRYEKINFCIKVKLLPGKDENYYKEKLKQDLREFLAPWSVGKYDKLSFGQCVNRSDIIRLLENSDYVDFISELCMVHHEDNIKCTDLLKNNKTVVSVCPKTPRSILIAGDIDVCIPEKDCERWDEKMKCENEVIPIADYCQKIIIG